MPLELKVELGQVVKLVTGVRKHFNFPGHSYSSSLPYSRELPGHLHTSASPLWRRVVFKSVKSFIEYKAGERVGPRGEHFAKKAEER